MEINICPNRCCDEKECNHYKPHEINEGCVMDFDDEVCPSCIELDEHPDDLEFIEKDEMEI